MNIKMYTNKESLNFEIKEVVPKIRCNEFEFNGIVYPLKPIWKPLEVHVISPNNFKNLFFEFYEKSLKSLEEMLTIELLSFHDTIRRRWVLKDCIITNCYLDNNSMLEFVFDKADFSQDLVA